MPLPNPVIVIPGVTATHLMDYYPVLPETVWGVMPYNKNYPRASLHPDNLRYEAREPARVMPDHVFDVVYGDLIDELRSELTERDDAPVPVYPFGYDWRQPLEDTESLLTEFIREVVDRTKLMKHYHADGYADRGLVNVVGHSMGGLIISGALRRHQGALTIEKVVTLGTPFGGSFEPITKVITGTDSLGVSSPSRRERKASRMTPSLYYLLPAIQDALTLNGQPLEDLYNPEHWQRNIIKTIATYVEERGLPTVDFDERATQIFCQMLENGKSYRGMLLSLNLRDIRMPPNNWLCVAGVGANTRVGMRVVTTDNGPEFRLSRDDVKNEWDEDHNSSQTGDGTVPIEAAVPRFLERSNVVCVTPDDFDWWRVADQAILKAGKLHGALPTMNMLHLMMVRHFTGSEDRHGNTWGRPAPGVEVEDWNPPLELSKPPS